MIDYLPHAPADYAQRVRLAGWFDLADIARQRFSEETWDIDLLLTEVETVTPTPERRDWRWQNRVRRK